jgi:hypothetical protein
LKGLKFEPVGQDLEDFMASKENLLELSTIRSRNWSTTIAEDDDYIRIYPDTEIICYCLQGFSFQMVCYDPRVGLNILLLDEATYAITQNFTVAVGIELAMQECGSHNHSNRRE